MNIGVIGYYGYGNAGDEIILENLRRFLYPHRVIPFQIGFPGSYEAIRRLNDLDFIILGGGGLYNYNSTPPAPFSTFDTWSHHLETPIGVLGLGVEKLESRFVETTRKLVDYAKFFVVRDEESKRLIEHPKIQVAPDLTFFSPIQASSYAKSIKRETVCGVNLRGTEKFSSEWIQAVSTLPCSKQGVPFSVHPEMDDRQLLVSIDPDCPAKFTTDIYASLDLLVGAAFHSVVFAIQSGVPAIAINYNPKVSRLMEIVGLREYILELDEWDNLGIIYERVLKNEVEIKQRMLDYTIQAQRELECLLEEIKYEIKNRKSVPNTLIGYSEVKVTIIVNCQKSTEEQVRKTVVSCLNQIYQNLEILILAETKQAKIISKTLNTNDTRIRYLSPKVDDQDYLVTGINSATGKYVSWLRAGDWYSDDAISVLVNALEDTASVSSLAYANYFLTDGNIIEWKAKIEEPSVAQQSGNFGSCFLIERKKASDFLRCKKDKDECSWLWNDNIMYIPHYLSFVITTESEKYLYASAIAFSLGQMQEAEQKFVQGVETNSESATDIIILDLFTEVTWRISRKSDYDEFLDKFFQEPSETKQFFLLKKKVLSRIAMGFFFEACMGRNLSNIFGILWIGILNDYMYWLRNRGVWKTLWRTFSSVILSRMGSG